ncbi:MAG: type II toxin-antitoxin system Phd/YefM family antitoxin [Micrococcales bacterium]|nr:type II toxin-antitoxin system Phd/YefM family antitoxin [Micrococcales bacterium]
MNNMKVITLQQLEADFDAILDDVTHNRQYYRIQVEGQDDVMLVPYEEYEVLADTYQDWVEEPAIDPFPLPVQYVADATPEQL